jgi:phosphate/sulfate permease
VLKHVLKEPRLYKPPQGDDRPPAWVRVVLIATCGSVSFAHGSNDGQKGMGLLLLVLIGFLPGHYALTVNDPGMAPKVHAGAAEVRAVYGKYEVPISEQLNKDLDFLEHELAGKATFADLPRGHDARWSVRQAIYRTIAEMKRLEGEPETPAILKQQLKKLREDRLAGAIEFIPWWVVVGTAVALGIGTTIGYKRIVVTVAEKIGKTHLAYAQGAAAEAITAATILAADIAHLPVSTTQVLSSGIAGTMIANGSGIQYGTVRKILLAWVLTLPGCMLLAGLLFTVIVSASRHRP